MYLSRLLIQNFGVIKSADLSFSKTAPVVGIIGKYDLGDSSEHSNRAGKSTLVAAIEYLLYGSARTRHHKKLINRTALSDNEGMILQGTFVLHGGEVLEVIRERAVDGRGVASVTGCEGGGWNEVTEYISSKIGFSCDEYRNTAYFGQGDIHAFMRAAPKEKRGLLLRWLDQTRWTRRAEHAKQAVEHYGEQVRVLGAQLAVLPQQEDEIVSLEKSIVDSCAELDSVERTIALKEADLVALNNEYEIEQKRIVTTNKINDLNARLARMEAHVEEAERAKKLATSLETKIMALETDRHEVLSVHNESVNSAHERLVLARNKLTELTSMRSAMSGAGGICPILKRSCDQIAGDGASDLEDLAMAARDNVSNAAHAHSVVVGARETAISEISNKISKLRREVPHYVDPDQLWESIDMFDAAIAENEAELAALPETSPNANERRDDINRELRALSSRHATINADITSAERALEAAVKNEQKRVSILKQVDDITDDLCSWRYCVYMFGDRGIPNEFIKRSFEALESDINYILRRLDTGLSVELRPYRELKKHEETCLACGYDYSQKPRGRVCPECSEARQRKRADELVMVIHDAMEDSESEFGLDSGGGQTLISFAVRLALLFFRVRNGSDMPPVVLDEIVGSLDPAYRNSVMDVVLNILTSEYGIEQIFWISHNPEIMELLDTGLVVTRRGAHSVVDWM